MNLSFFCCQTLPDIAGARALYNLDDSISDKHVAKIIFHHHIQQQGRDALYLAPFHAMLSVAALIEIRDFEVHLVSLDLHDRSEMQLLAALSPKLDGQQVRCWDDGHQLAALLKTRMLVHGESLKQLPLQSIEASLSMVPGDISIDQLAGRLGFPVQQCISDETAWDIYRQDGIMPLSVRCRENLLATSLIGLRQLWLADVIDEEACDELSSACRQQIEHFTQVA